VRICSIRQYRLPVKPRSGRNWLAQQAVLFASIYGTAEFFHPTGKAVDWKTVNRRLQDHKAKVRQILTIASDPFKSMEEKIKEQMAKRGAAMIHNRTKNAAFYSDVVDGVFRKPSEQFDQAKAEEELNFAKMTLKFCSWVESLVAGKIEFLASTYEEELALVDKYMELEQKIASKEKELTKLLNRTNKI
jgi:AbiV family abortive infection protein